MSLYMVLIMYFGSTLDSYDLWNRIFFGTSSPFKVVPISSMYELQNCGSHMLLNGAAEQNVCAAVVVNLSVIVPVCCSAG